MKNIVTCTICPNGCEIEVDYTTREDAKITGHRCKRGESYALDECFEPKRTFTSSIKITGTDRRVLPVRTTGPIPKELIMKAAEEVGLEIVPFDAGFFASVPCDNPDEISAKLEKEGIFLVPLAKGIRVSIASISEEKCRMIPARIVEAMK